MKTHTLLFDLDGTLLDSTDAIVSTFYHSFDEMNINFEGSQEEIKALIGHPLEDMYEQLHVPKNRVDDCVQSYKRRYRTISKQQTQLIPTALEALKLASTFAQLSVVTTKTGSASVALLNHLGIGQYFKVITGREDVIHPKPHPEPILTTLKQMKAPSNNTVWMIGDTRLDLIAAQKAHIQSVGVLCGYGTKEELQMYTPHITTTPLQAVELILNQ